MTQVTDFAPKPYYESVEPRPIPRVQPNHPETVYYQGREYAIIRERERRR